MRQRGYASGKMFLVLIAVVLGGAVVAFNVYRWFRGDEPYWETTTIDMHNEFELEKMHYYLPRAGCRVKLPLGYAIPRVIVAPEADAAWDAHHSDGSQITLVAATLKPGDTFEKMVAAMAARLTRPVKGVVESQAIGDIEDMRTFVVTYTHMRDVDKFRTRAYLVEAPHGRVYLLIASSKIENYREGTFDSFASTFQVGIWTQSPYTPGGQSSMTAEVAPRKVNSGPPQKTQRVTDVPDLKTDPFSVIAGNYVEEKDPLSVSSGNSSANSNSQATTIRPPQNNNNTPSGNTQTPPNNQTAVAQTNPGASNSTAQGELFKQPKPPANSSTTGDPANQLAKADPPLPPSGEGMVSAPVIGADVEVYCFGEWRKAKVEALWPGGVKAMVRFNDDGGRDPVVYARIRLPKSGTQTAEVAKPPVEVAKPPVEIAKPPAEIAKPPVEVAKPPIEIVKPPVKDPEPENPWKVGMRIEYEDNGRIVTGVINEVRARTAWVRRDDGQFKSVGFTRLREVP